MPTPKVWSPSSHPLICVRRVLLSDRRIYIREKIKSQFQRLLQLFIHKTVGQRISKRDLKIMYSQFNIIKKKYYLTFGPQQPSHMLLSGCWTWLTHVHNRASPVAPAQMEVTSSQRSRENPPNLRGCQTATCGCQTGGVFKRPISPIVYMPRLQWPHTVIRVLTLNSATPTLLLHHA